MFISTILPPATVKPSTAKGASPANVTTPGAPLTSASVIAAICSNGTSNTSCRTNASRSAGGRLSARGRSIPLELDAHVRQVDGELEIEATTVAPHRELGMTLSALGTISPRSQLFVKAHLMTTADSAA
jgi:hypothetical protein